MCKRGVAKSRNRAELTDHLIMLSNCSGGLDGLYHYQRDVNTPNEGKCLVEFFSRPPSAGYRPHERPRWFSGRRARAGPLTLRRRYRTAGRRPAGTQSARPPAPSPCKPWRMSAECCYLFSELGFFTSVNLCVYAWRPVEAAASCSTNRRV